MLTYLTKFASLAAVALAAVVLTPNTARAGRDFAPTYAPAKAKAMSNAAMVDPATADGVVKLKSAYGMAETVMRLQDDITNKKIMIFTVVDQSRLAAAAGIDLGPSTLLIFGNPPLGTQFITSNPAAGLDWPVRLLVYEDHNGGVWLAYTDFRYIARRHGISDRIPQFDMASRVIASIASSVQAK
jgi:uncharacterized protein (DUF302 family)